MNTNADTIRKTDERAYNAWAAQRAAYGMSVDDATFVAWHETMEAQERDRIRAALAS